MSYVFGNISMMFFLITYMKEALNGKIDTRYEKTEGRIQVGSKRTDTDETSAIFKTDCQKSDGFTIDDLKENG